MAIIRQHTDEKELHAGLGGSTLLAGKPKEDGLRVVFLGASHIKEKMTGVLLPAFDESLDTCDEAHASSYVPCWTNVKDAPRAPKHFIPSPWAVPLMIYTFVGPENRHFLAPANRTKMICGMMQQPDPADLRDPFNDLRSYIRNNKEYDQASKDYYLKGSATASALVPARSTRFMSFAKIRTRDDNAPRIAILSRTSTCHDFEITQMRWGPEEGRPPRSDRFRQYLLGDPTDPDGALVWYVDKFLVDKKDPQETNVIRWTEHIEMLPENPATMPITHEDLLKRFLFVDDTCWNIPTYQEMLDVLIDEMTDIDMELIKAACDRYGDVHAREGERTTKRQPGAARPQVDDEVQGTLRGFSGEVTEDDDDIPMHDEPPMPAAKPAPTPASPQPAAPAPTPPAPPTPPPAPPAASTPPPPPPPPVVEPSYWVFVTGGQPEWKSKSEIAAMLQSAPDLQVNVDDVWKPAASLFATPAASPPPPAAAPAQPAVVSESDIAKTRELLLSGKTFSYEKISAGQRKYVDDLVREIVLARSQSSVLSLELSQRMTDVVGGKLPAV